MRKLYLVSLGLFGLFLSYLAFILYLNVFGQTREPYPEPPIQGQIEIVNGVPHEGSWYFEPGEWVGMALVFRPKKNYTAKSLSILLDLDGLEVIEASSGWDIREGRYLWRYPRLKGEEKRIELKAMIPEGVHKEYQISFLYAYPDEPLSVLDTQTIITVGIE